jgi:hypothetical protein
MTQEFKVGDKVKAIAYTDCFGKEHAEVGGLIVLSVKHIPAQHGLAAYDRLDCELVNPGEALANRHKLQEIIRVEAAARFFAHEGQHVPPTCICGSVLSAVTFTCVRGVDCDARYQLSPHMFTVCQGIRRIAGRLRDERGTQLWPW